MEKFRGSDLRGESMLQSICRSSNSAAKWNRGFRSRVKLQKLKVSLSWKKMKSTDLRRCSRMVQILRSKREASLGWIFCDPSSSRLERSSPICSFSFPFSPMPAVAADSRLGKDGSASRPPFYLPP